MTYYLILQKINKNVFTRPEEIMQNIRRVNRFLEKKVLYEGPDLSKHNGNVNIKSIRDAGYKRIGLRVGYGKNNVDEKYISNASACVNLGVPVVLYWFSYAYTEAMAEKEAEYAINQAKKYWKKCPIAFDFEYGSVNYARKNGVNITQSMCTKMAIAFLKKIREAGYIPVIYANKDYLKNYFHLEQIKREVGTVYLWYARYTDELPESELLKADLWQYTSKGKIAGVSGNVDLNKFYSDFDDLNVEETKENSTCNINILDFQKAANADGYRDSSGKELVEDGKDGPKTQYVRKKINLKAKRKGLSYVTGSKGALVKYMQRRTNEILGHKNKVDGCYGKDTRKEIMELQEKLKLKEDGIAGYNTIQAVFYN